MKCSMPGLFANVISDLRDRVKINADQYEVALEEIIGHVRDVAEGRHTIEEFVEHYCIPVSSGQLEPAASQPFNAEKK